MSLATFTKVLKSYNESGLGGAFRTMFAKDECSDKTIRLTASDLGIFTTIERRLARTQLANMTMYGSSNKAQEFNNQLIGFTMALEAMRKHVASKNKPRSYIIHLTFSDTLATTPYFKLAAKSSASGEYHMSAIIRGLT